MMSVTDPLLKELKGSVLKLVQTAGSDGITDSSTELQPFCQNIERIFQKGLLRTYTLGFSKEPESWDWLEQLPSYINETTVAFSYVSALNMVKSSQKVVTARGKLRLLIRFCLIKKCLHIPVEQLVRQKLPGHIYDKDHSILGNEILGEIFFSVLLQCSRLKFELDINNASFLDETWSLPTYIQMEFVPCRALGICVSFVRGKAVIVSRQSNSVAAEDDKIEVGDILDELNGYQINIQRKGSLPALMRKSSGQPIKAAIIKARIPNTQELYPPIIGLLRQAHLDPDELLLQYISRNKSEESEKQGEIIRPGFEVIYMGSITTGRRGDVRQIDMAIKSFIHNQKMRLNQPCLFEIQEVGVKVTDQENGKTCMEFPRLQYAEVIDWPVNGIHVAQEFYDIARFPNVTTIIQKHSYMEISSCGRTLSFNNYFAYIAGEENCSIAKNFTCFVFHCANEETIKTILQSIGQGFQRTHFAV